MTSAKTTQVPEGVARAGDWVSFPLKQSNSCTIEWYGAGKSQSGVYYVDKCWFGKLASEKQSKKQDPLLYAKGLSIDGLGTTLIFIASEFVEERLVGAPHLKRWHVYDRMEAARKNYTDVPADWALLPINSDFHYGESPDHMLRWLIYHPGLENKEFQHRFHGRSAISIAQAGIEFVDDAPKPKVSQSNLPPQPKAERKAAESVEESVKIEGKLISVALNTVINFICAVTGHTLHGFNDPEEKDAFESAPEKADKNIQAIKAEMAKSATKTTDVAITSLRLPEEPVKINIKAMASLTEGLDEELENIPEGRSLTMSEQKELWWSYLVDGANRAPESGYKVKESRRNGLLRQLNNGEGLPPERLANVFQINPKQSSGNRPRAKIDIKTRGKSTTAKTVLSETGETPTAANTVLSETRGRPIEARELERIDWRSGSTRQPVI